TDPMRKSRFSEAQIVSILKEADAGMKVADVCRKHGVSEPTYYKWKSKYGGLEASELKRIKDAGSREHQTQAHQGCWKPRTPNSSACMPRWPWSTMPSRS